MLDKVLKHTLTSTQLWILSIRTCQWWNAVFVQAKRFLDEFDSTHGATPWDEETNMYIADRMFLIVAIYHALENLQMLDMELQKENDYSMSIVLDAINSVAPLEDIKNLRDMNIHGLDYLVEKGRKQDQYKCLVTEGEYTIQTTPAWTVVHGDAKMILMGNVHVDKLLLVMKEHLPMVQAKTKEIFDNNI